MVSPSSAGVYLLHRFLTRLGFKAAVAKEVAFAQRNNRYTVGELLRAILYPMILGLERIETTARLQANGVFRYRIGLPTYPDPTTLRRFLLREANQLKCRRIDHPIPFGCSHPGLAWGVILGSEALGNVPGLGSYNPAMGLGKDPAGGTRG